MFPDATLQTTAGSESMALPFDGQFDGADMAAFAIEQTGLGDAGYFRASDAGNYCSALTAVNSEACASGDINVRILARFCNQPRLQ